MRRYVFQFALLAGMTLVPVVAMGDDNQIAQTIVQKLQAEKKTGSLKGFNLELQVQEGTVWLSGRVSTPEQQARALDIARRVQGVKQVVNDITITESAPANNKFSSEDSPSQSKNMLASMNLPVDPTPATPTPALSPRGEVGSGVVASSSPVPTGIQAIAPQSPAMQPYAGAPAHQSQVPMAYAPARYVNHQEGMPSQYAGEGYGQPVPMHTGGGMGIAPARYDHPSMPGHAWPSYAAYPNYAAVTYPKQYSPTAWPYIGPFYPYPQVPLGWRKVTMEWDDGWWFLDFKNRRYR
ncbi:periplasmic protein [Anatilimnocola aggregata]|uniref:Periplasmic protein n=1 Tax=Anatilimnocola aggregata TaxID=2528021 RepID=A0A517Y4U6_9BACT|nr:BON domain-containing protein [Anatilimnocola aggregata]QDU25210.1 periplasmic protein [Anatilimnocola aggregata]